MSDETSNSDENSNSEFWTSLHDEARLRLGDQRIGQSYFNALHRLRPDIANQIRSSNDDPFYNTDLLPRFFTAIAELL